MKLADIIDSFIAGDWGDETISTDNSNAVFCVRGADIVPVTNHKFDDILLRFISDRSIQTKMLRAGDIVIEKSGGSPTQSTGRVVYISEELVKAKGNLVCSNFCTAIRVKSSWNPLYVYYYWQNVYNTGVFFNFEGKTSGIKNLQLENALAAIDIEYIPLEQQNKIVKVLSAIDQKIAINQAINQNLEAMAKQLYDYWFVQFDFPNAEGKPYKSSGGKMIWNDELKRNIPSDWNICSLGSYIAKNNTGDWGYDEPTEKRQTKVGCVRGADILKLNNLPQRYIKDSNTNKLLSPWDIVIEVSGGSPTQATGRSAYITPGVLERNGGKLTCSNFCHAFTLNDSIFSAFFYYTWTMLYDNDNMFNYEGKTSGIKNFMTETFLANKWIKSPRRIAEKFFIQIKAIYEQIDVNEKEIITLTKQRDELLPLLMNGQVSVNSDLSLD